MAMAELRYGTVDEEKTELILVGSVAAEDADDGEAYCIVALPFLDEHTGQWTAFPVKNLRGEVRRVRFSRIPLNQRKGVRKQKPASWVEFTSFADGDQFRLEALGKAYEGSEEDLNKSMVEKGSDAEMEDDEPVNTGLPSTLAANPFATVGQGAAPNGVVEVPPVPSPIPVQPSSSEEDTALPGWVRTLGVQVAAVTLKAEKNEAAVDLKIAEFQKQQEANTAVTQKKLVELENTMVAMQTGMAELLSLARGGGSSSSSGLSAPAAGQPRSALRQPQPQEDAALLEDLNLGNLPVLSGRKPQKRQVSFPQAGPTSGDQQGPDRTSDTRTDEILANLAATQEMQLKLLTKLSGGSEGFGADLLLGSTEPSVVRSAKERELFKARLRDKPKDVVKEHWEQCRSEAGCDPGEPFSMKTYGDKMLGKDFVGHSVLHRVWEMLAAEHAHFRAGNGDRAYAQNVQNLKAVAKAVRAGGLWRGAWELTYLPEPGEVEGGVSMEENASLAKYMKEKAAMEKLLSDARESAKKNKEL